MDQPTCRACGGAGLTGPRARCATCGGAWIATLALLDQIADAAAQPMSGLPWIERTEPSARVCESCTEPLRAVALYGVALDRCKAHGVWLDRDELAQVLTEARRQTPHFDPSTAARWGNASPSSGAVADALLGDHLAPSQAGRDGLLGALFKLFS